MNTSTFPQPQIDERPAEQPAHAANKLNTGVAIIGALFLVIAIVAASALGVWSYQLNTKLAATQAQLASLQVEHDQLKADHTSLAAERTQLNATIEQGKADLAKAYADLNTANDRVAAQRAKMELAKNLMSISEATVNGDSYTAIEEMVRRTQDSQLIGLWNTLARSPNEENLLAFYQYLSEAFSTALE